jgi:uncharacterized protein YndB with AHSA1/START domain
MSTEPTQKQLSVSVDVAASPDIVWSVVSDLSRMKEWSPECVAVHWKGADPGPAGPSVGSVFKGTNKIGLRRWSTKGTIVAADTNKELAFDISALGLPVARWSYSIGPSDNGCRLTETFEDKRGAFVKFVGTLTTGVKDRMTHNDAGMRTTLERMKAAAEARATPA